VNRHPRDACLAGEGKAVSTRSWWGEELLGRGPDDAVWARGNTEVTLARLRAEVSWLATVLGHHGIRMGSTVAFQGTPSFTQLWAVLACWSLGAQVILLEPGVPRAEAGELLARCAPQFSVCFGGLVRNRRAFVDECGVYVSRLPGGRPATTPHCLIQFSSGTTGRMKIVGRTPESLLHELDRMRGLDGLAGPGERLLLLDSPTNSFGLVGGVLRGLDTGHAVLFAPATDPVAVLQAAAEADVIVGAPRHFQPLSAAERPPTLARLRTVVSGGDVITAHVSDGFADRFGVPIGQCYGTTETGLLAAEPRGQYLSPSLGHPVPGVRTRIADGVLEVHVASSPYPHDPGPLARGGWLSTHDLVTAEPGTGLLRLRGRLGPAGGAADADVDLLRIESVLRTHEKVDAAVVVGEDSLIEAHVAGAAELDHVELSAWCRRFLDGDALPARYHVRRRLPTTANGKFVRSRELLLAHG
jgi:3-hydroxy-4-methylanthranilate adenylyltransferase